MGSADDGQSFRNPKPELLALLEQSGPAGDANGVRGKGDAAKKKGKKNQTVWLPALLDCREYGLT